MGLILLTIGILLVPFTVIKFKSVAVSAPTKSVIDQSPANRIRTILAVIFFLWVALLLGGYFLINNGQLAILVMPVLAIMGILLPIGAFIFITWRKVGPLEISRSWGVLSTGMTLSPLLGFILEFGLLVLLFAFIMIILMQDSSLLNDLEITATRLASGQDNPQIINHMLVSFLDRPINRFLVYSIIAGLIPIIEEIVKQIPIWLLAWRKLSPRAGLLIGALGGAGFALTESLMTVSALGGTEQWLYQILGRAGAGLMHIITGAIGGWGLASAMQGKSYLKAVLAYLVSVIIHSLWNAIATWDSLTQLAGSSSLSSSAFQQGGLFPLITLGGLFLIMFLFLLNIQKVIKD